ncbi:MAG: triose-phosphate isomerase [Mesorhizobium sp.]|nr:MAG: triose-phosphate isomerase [Mesorhizobium sp.]
MTADRQLWVGTSWKMNKTLAEACGFAERLSEAHHGVNDRIQRFVIPSFTAVREVKKVLKGTSVKVGAQNMHWEDEGAWTGEVSPVMLKDCDLDLVEIGHSERREHFGETDETVGLKTEAAVRHGLVPLICIGETLDDRQAGRATEVLAGQVHGALGRLNGSQREAEILLAYEPVWAIGDRGVPATAEYANARHAEIASLAEQLLGRRIPCLFGRSAWDVEGYLDILSRCAAKI